MPRFESFRQGAALIGFEQNRITRPMNCSLTHAGHLGNEKIVPDDLHAIADFSRELNEAESIILCQRIFNRDDRIALQPANKKTNHAFAVEFFAF